ncbi:MAG: hypothetical protein EZS28_043870, partial [Streblomastix strix]
MFEDCTPSNEKNVYFEFRVNNQFEFSGYITSGTIEQDPGEDLEEGTEGCIWNVNQTGDGINSKKTIRSVLAGICDDPEGYQITLLNNIHYESITINKTENFPVLIKGGAKDEEETKIHTVWGVNTSVARTITLLQGDLTIQNIQFIFFENTNEIQDEQDENIWPWNAIIYAYDQSLTYRILSLESCIFKGLGSDKFVNKMIYAHQMNKLNITKCSFQDAYINDSYAVYFQSGHNNSEIIVENSTFENINVTNYGRGALYINLESGYQTGCIYGDFWYGGTFNFSNNEFLNNSRHQSGNGANDAYLQWVEYPQDW